MRLPVQIRAAIQSANLAYAELEKNPAATNEALGELANHTYDLYDELDSALN